MRVLGYLLMFCMLEEVLTLTTRLYNCRYPIGHFMCDKNDQHYDAYAEDGIIPRYQNRSPKKQKIKIMTAKRLMNISQYYTDKVWNKS